MKGVARARFSPDELTAWISVRTDEWHVATATRATRDSAFGDFSFVGSLYWAGRHDLSPSPARDGRVIYMESFVEASLVENWEMRVATRATPTDPFSLPIAFPIAISGDGGPYALPNDEAVYFHRNTDGESDIFRVDHHGGVFGEAELVPGVDTENAWEGFPVVTDDELTIYFLAYGASGDPWDMWVASRPSREVPFGDVHSLASLNTEAAEAPTWVSPDGCRFYFERCDVGTWDPTNAIFVVERMRPSE